MKKVFLLRPNEAWIVDRFVNEFNKDNSNISIKDPADADVIWLFANWCWQQIPSRFLTSKKVITTIHHIVPEKFNAAEFQFCDGFTDVYHVPNEYTRTFIEKLTTKPIVTIPYWANQQIWKVTETKDDLRNKYQFPTDAFIVGSFVRDTEGAGISQGIFTPKLEKGPDLLCEFLDKTWHSQKNLHVVLAGWRRQFVITHLEKQKIPFTYTEFPSQTVLNELYQCCDLYPVTARYEGGPQSLIECGLLKIPVVSRPVGMASQVLSQNAINDDVSLATPEVPNVVHLMLPQGYQPYLKLIESL